MADQAELLPVFFLGTGLALPAQTEVNATRGLTFLALGFKSYLVGAQSEFLGLEVVVAFIFLP